MGKLPYKSDGDTRRLALRCQLQIWSHLGCLGWKVTIFAHSGINSTVHKEIDKKCPDTDHPENLPS